MLSKKTVKILAGVLIVILWMGTVAVTAIWALGVQVPFEPEPITVLLGLISAAVSVAVTGVVYEYGSLLDFEEYTTPYALAYGYVNNFIEPVITSLLNSSTPGEKIEFYIYIPDQLSDLYKRSVERTMSEVKQAGYDSEVVNLNLDASRTRDVMTVFKGSSGEVKYFDFPNTLLTLVSLIDFKSESRRDSFDDEQKTALGRKYIQAFEREVRKLIEKKNLGDYVFFTDRSLDFLNQQ